MRRYPNRDCRHGYPEDAGGLLAQEGGGAHEREAEGNAEWPLVSITKSGNVAFSARDLQPGLGSVSIGQTYTYTELRPSGWVSAGARAINNSEAVVGSGSDVPDALKGFIYSGGAYIPLLPTGWTYAEAYAINDNGVVVGDGLVGDTWKAFKYSAGAYTVLLPDGWTEAYAYAINSSGMVVGSGLKNGIPMGLSTTTERTPNCCRQDGPRLTQTPSMIVELWWVGVTRVMLTRVLSTTTEFTPT